MKFFIALAFVVVAVNATLLEERQRWTLYKNEHEKSYELSEDKLRFEIFQNNLKTIQEHNEKYQKGEVGYFMTTTKFADWTQEEFNAMLKTQASNKPQLNYVSKFEANPNYVAPASIDWREKGAVLEVKDQGQCGSCWAFSTTGSLEGQFAIHKNIKTTLSEQELVDCSTVNAGCGGGNMEYAFDYIKENGLSSEAQYAYTAVDGRCNARNIQNKQVKTISGYVEVAQTENALREAVGTVGPISIAVEANNGWQFYGGGVFDGVCGNALNHGVLAVGYADNYWVVKNSWGAGWGEKGFIKLVSGRNQCGLNLDNSYPKL